MSELLNHSLLSAKHGLKKADFTAKELVAAHLESIEKNRNLNAFITVTAEAALENAEKADLSLPMGGLPIGMKDLFCTKGVRTTAGFQNAGKFYSTL